VKLGVIPEIDVAPERLLAETNDSTTVKLIGHMQYFSKCFDDLFSIIHHHIYSERLDYSF